VKEVAERLTAAGFSAAEADRKARLFDSAEQRIALLTRRACESAPRWFVPGRIEVFGKHTDYAGGRSLLCAVERGIGVVARPRSDRVVRIADAILGLESSLTLSDEQAAPEAGWTAYPAAVVRRIARDFPGRLVGADIAIASDLPRSAGLSSGSALVVAIFTALAHVNALEDHAAYRANIRSAEDLAGYLGAVENGLAFGTLDGGHGVGTFGGSEDHTAILCCRAGHVSQYSFLPVRREREAAVPPHWTFVVAASGVIAEKAGAARALYNRLSLAAAAILGVWRQKTGAAGETLGQVAREPGGPERIREVLREAIHSGFSAGELSGRFGQFLEESEVLVPAAARAFEAADAAALSEIAALSQAGAERFLGNQVPETIGLVASARALGAIAASAFGAGFGGSVWALVEGEQAESFRVAWQNDYRRAFPGAAPSSEFFATRAGPGRLRL
jgi:galactokinase